MATKQSHRRPDSRSRNHSTNRRTSYNSRNSRGSAKNTQSGISGFYKIMGILAVLGIIAALYLGGQLSLLADYITGEPGSEISQILDGSSLFDSMSTTTVPPVPTTSSGETTTTRLTTTTTTASATTASTTTTTITTTASTLPEPPDAEYVLSPNYESPYYIVVFTGSQSVVVYGKDENGYYNVETKCFTCSSGASDTPTRTGLYSIIRSYRWRALMGGVYGQYCSGFSSSYLFHSVLYDVKDESTLYENSYRNLGTAASHGCIRLCVRDAKWIYDNCPHGTQVRVVNASGPEGGELPELKSGSRYRGWDPTDPHEDNPYNN